MLTVDRNFGTTYVRLAMKLSGLFSWHGQRSPDGQTIMLNSQTKNARSRHKKEQELLPIPKSPQVRRVVRA
jgi:hypothetical protein